MHAIHLTELAVVFSMHAEAQLQLEYCPPREDGNSFWLASRFRHEEWSGRLARHRTEVQRPGASHRAYCWNSVYPIMQEILLAEPLTRVLSYYGELLEARKPTPATGQFVSLASTCLHSHVEARNRCLNLIVFGQGLPVEHATRLNRLRRHMEQVTDALLACFPQHRSLQEHAFEPLELAEQHHALTSARDKQQALRVHATSLRMQLWNDNFSSIDSRASSKRLNRRISQVVLKMFGKQLFDSFGTPVSAEFARLSDPPVCADTTLDANDRTLQDLLVPVAQRPEAVTRRW